MKNCLENIKKLRVLVDNLTIRDAETFEMVDILRLTLEHNTDGYWDWDMINDYQYLSPGLKKQLGYDVDEMENNPLSWQELIFKEDLNKMSSELQKHIDSKGVVPFRTIVRYKHKDGHIIKILCRGSVIMWSEDGQPLRMVGTHIDITVL